LGGQRLAGATGPWWGETQRWCEQAVANVLWRTEKLLRASAWLEVDVPRLGSRELMEEDDGGGSVCVGHCSRRFELDAVAACRGRRGDCLLGFDGEGRVWTVVATVNWVVVSERRAEWW
jgi:hypothetical protein